MVPTCPCVWSSLGAPASREQAARLEGLGQDVVARVLGHTDARLVAVPKLVILPDLDVVRSTPAELRPDTEDDVEIAPDVARLDSGAALVIEMIYSN
jgi:hypothetical protein